MSDIALEKIQSAWEYAIGHNEYGKDDKMSIVRAYIDAALPNALSFLDEEFGFNKICKSNGVLTAGELPDVAQHTINEWVSVVNPASPPEVSGMLLEMNKMSNPLIETVTKSEGDGNHPSSHYLVVEDPDKPTTWHLRVKDASGKVDRGLMGGASAALHGGYRGNKYEGPNKEEAIAKLKSLYKSEGADLPGEKKNEEKSAMDKKDEMKEPPEEEKKETPKEEKKEDEGEKMKAAYVKMCKDMEDMTANLKTMEATKTEMEQKMKAAEEALGKANETIKAHRIEELKSKLVGSVMEEEEFKAETEALLALPEKAIELMTRNRKEQPTEDGKLKMAASEKPVEAPDKWVIA